MTELITPGEPRLSLNLPPEWDASTPERLLAVKDSVLAAARGDATVAAWFDSFTQQALSAPDTLLAWLFLPLLTDDGSLTGIISATMVARVSPPPAGGAMPSLEQACQLAPTIRRSWRVKEPIPGGLELEYHVVRYDVSLGTGQVFAAEFRTPNTFMSDEFDDLFEQIIDTLDFVELLPGD